jgi:hypothetical protein
MTGFSRLTHQVNAEKRLFSGRFVVPVVFVVVNALLPNCYALRNEML